eukprot:6819145-Prymnesium_polylepis.1
MADSEQDEMYEDAEDSGDEKQRVQDPQDGQRARPDPQQGGHRFQVPQVHLRRAAGRRDRGPRDAA